MLKHSPNTGFISSITVLNTEKHLENLMRVIPWEYYKNTKRKVCSIGKEYSYSGQTQKAVDWSVYPPLKSLVDRINKELGTNFNSVLLNWYPGNNARSGINPHSDNEREIVRGSSVLSVSLGASVNFYLTSNDGNEQIKVQLNDGDVFLMGENAQLFYKHHIPYTVMKKDRISLTFRQFK